MQNVLLKILYWKSIVQKCVDCPFVKKIILFWQKLKYIYSQLMSKEATVYLWWFWILLHNYANVILECSLQRNLGRIGVNESILTIMKQIWTKMNRYFCKWRAQCVIQVHVIIIMALLACQETSNGINKRSRTQNLEISHQFSLEQVTNYIISSVLEKRSHNWCQNWIFKEFSTALKYFQKSRSFQWIEGVLQPLM